MTGMLRGAPLVALVVGLAIVAALAMRMYPVAAEEGLLIPPPVLDRSPGQTTSEVAVLAGGCFWGVQGVFQHVKGVTSAVSGYAGGDRGSANYVRVSLGTTQHAESVKVTFDPRQITYGQLLRIYFSVVHDPTELNRQGPDDGPQYRSAIFPADAEQEKVAEAYIVQLMQANVFHRPIVTTIEKGSTFFQAEEDHQDFLTRNPTYPYIAINDLPKVENLKRLFPESYRANPVLVLPAASSN